MATMTLNIPVEIPQGYSTERLERKLREYAVHLVYVDTVAKPAKRYRHRALCGVIAPEKCEGEYVDEYLQDKYKV